MGSSFPWPVTRPYTVWHNDAARQEESISSFAADGDMRDHEPPRLKRKTLGGLRREDYMRETKAVRTRCEHANPILNVASLARSVRYYVDILGFTNAE